MKSKLDLHKGNLIQAARNSYRYYKCKSGGYYSQFGEDRWIKENLNPAIGNFCEVGAFDGMTASNTLYFEEHGWNGILVEPDPYFASECQKHRKAATWCCAAGLKNYTIFNKIDNEPQTSGLLRKGKKAPCVVVPLVDLLQASGISHLNLLSIDTEGTELEVWSTRGHFHPTIVIMECATSGLPSTEEQTVRQMRIDGYEEVYKTETNIIFVSN